jgi:hypothetical protein
MSDTATKVKTDENGNIVLLSGLEPNMVYTIERQGKAIRLEPTPTTTTEPFWKTATPEEWVKAFNEWIDSLPPGPGLSDWAVSRDSIYD